MLPFRLGTTCFVYREDLVTNVRRLAELAQDVEIILYETEKWGTNFPTLDQVKELSALAQANDLSYTLHLPLDLKCGDSRAYDQAQRAIEVTRPLDPYAYVMHLDGSVFLDDTGPETIAHWQAELPAVLQDVSAWVGDPKKVCVENLERWNPVYFARAVAEAGVSRCVDIGHMWKEGNDPLPHLAQHLAQTRVVHLHGMTTSDHQSLRHMPDAQLFPVVEALLRHPFRGVLTLEVYSPEDFSTSRAAILRAVAQIA